MTMTTSNLLESIGARKREVVPEGSIVAYCYKSQQVELVLSGKYIDDNQFKLKPTSAVKGYLSGENGVVLSRFIQGVWRDRPLAIAVLERAKVV